MFYRTQLHSDNAPKAIGPYSQAIMVNNMIFTSGQIPIDPSSGNIVDGDIKSQTSQVMKNLKAVLSEANSSLADVVKTCVFLKDMNSFAEFNEIYSQHFKEPYPARSCVEVARLPKDVLIEIEAIAII